MNTMQQWLFLSLLKVCSWLPITVARKFGRLVSTFLWRFNSRNRLVTEANLQYCYPTLSLGEQQELARKSYIGAGEGIAEMGSVWLNPVSQILAMVESVDSEALFKEANGLRIS